MIPKKLAKLIPMLSSPMDGEVVAAARAIEKSLKGAGLDWHDLVNAISFKAKPSKAWADTGHNAEPGHKPGATVYDDLYADFLRRERQRMEEAMRGYSYHAEERYHWDEAAGEFRKATKEDRARYWEGRKKGEQA